MPTKSLKEKKQSFGTCRHLPCGFSLIAMRSYGNRRKFELLFFKRLLFFFLFYLFLIVFLSWQLNGDQYNLDSSCAAILCSSQSFGSEI